MCHFVSWIGFQGSKDILFLTDEDVFDTKEGKKLQAYCGAKADLVGHGAIRRYYRIPRRLNQTDRECVTLNPQDYPVKIQKAILSGKMDKLAAIGQSLSKIYKLAQPPRKQRVARIMEAIGDSITDKGVKAEIKRTLLAQPVLDVDQFFNAGSILRVLDTTKASPMYDWSYIDDMLPSMTYDEVVDLIDKPIIKGLLPKWKAAKQRLFPKRK